MKRLLIFGSLFMVMGLLLSSCATMFGDNARDLTIISNPSGGKVYLNNQYIGNTPTTLHLSQYLYSSNYIRVEAPGMQAQTMPIQTTFQLVGLLNILNMPVGFIVDGATGDIIKLSSHTMAFSLK